ncbi:MAG: ABC transporter permease [Candidatus Eisenbacteria bacterium]
MGGRRNGSGPPGIMVLLAAVMLGFFLLPLAGLLARAPWSDAVAQLGSEGVLTAFRISLVTATAAALLGLLFGFPLAWILARARFRGKGLIRALVLLPMVLPPVVGGVALLTAFGRRGLLGGALAAIGVRLPFSIAGAILAATFVSAPFLILTLEAGIASSDRRLEEAAATLGAGRWRVMRTILLPSIRPSLVAGAALAWARAIGEFGATITFAGNFPGRTQTVPLAVYETLQTDFHGAILLSLILLAVSLGALVLLRGRRGSRWA